MRALDGGRINIGACSVGGGQFCLDYAHRYVRERRQFGQPLDSFQATQVHRRRALMCCCNLGRSLLPATSCADLSIVQHHCGLVV